MSEIYRANTELDSLMMENAAIVCEQDTPYDPEDPRNGIVYHRHIYYNVDGATICNGCGMNLDELSTEMDADTFLLES